MNADEATSYLAGGVMDNGADVFAGIVKEIGEKAGYPLKSLTMNFYDDMESPLRGLTWKFPRPDVAPPEEA